MNINKLILVAEDEVSYGKILKNELEKKGYKVEIALNGVEVLKKALAKKPLLIILDLMMPLKNGFQVLTEMKKDQRLKKIKVIALSNLGQESDIKKAADLGADEYIVKSDVSFYAVLDKITKLLKKN